MRNLIFIYFISGLFCFVSSCDGRKKTEEKEISTTIDNSSSAASEPALETVENKPKAPSQDSKVENSETISSNEPSSVDIEQPDSVKFADSEGQGSETAQDSLAETEELKGIQQEKFAAVPPELADKIVLHDLPSKDAVGISAYTNSYVIRMNNKVKYKDKFYITMELASSDAPEQVLNFYQKRRENWFYVQNAAVHTFKKDEDKYFRETNTLQILPFDKSMYREIDSLLSFDAQTLIRIYYELPAQ